MKKRLLFVNGHLNVGGVEKSLVDLLNHLDYSKYDVDLLLLRDYGVYRGLLSEHVNVLLFDTSIIDGSIVHGVVNALKKKKWQLAWFKVLLSLSKFAGKKILSGAKCILPLTSHYDCAISYRHDLCAEIVAYAVNSDKTLCWWHHGEWTVPKESIFDITSLWNDMDLIVTVSDGCRNMIQAKLPTLRTPVVVIPNMVDSNMVEQFSLEYKPILPCKRSVVLMTITRLYVEKWVIDVPRAARLMLDKGFSHFTWYIVGDGDKYADVDAEIKKLGLQQYVFLLGATSNPYPYMRCANIFVHPSHVESQCLSVIEAMALKKPCVVCNSIGPSSYIESGKNGLLVGMTPEDIVSGIEQLLQRDDLSVMGEDAYETVCEAFCPQRVMECFYLQIA